MMSVKEQVARSYLVTLQVAGGNLLLSPFL